MKELSYNTPASHATENNSHLKLPGIEGAGILTGRSGRAEVFSRLPLLVQTSNCVTTLWATHFVSYPKFCILYNQSKASNADIPGPLKPGSSLIFKLTAMLHRFKTYLILAAIVVIALVLVMNKFLVYGLVVFAVGTAAVGAYHSFYETEKTMRYTI